MNRELSLRPAREDDMAMLEELTQDPSRTGEFQWFGWSDPRRWRRAWEENGLVGEDGGILIVTRADSGSDSGSGSGSGSGDGQRLGLVNWRRHPVPNAAYCWEIGIILTPEARGRGHGARAQRLLVDYLFAHTTAHRIWAGTEVDNIAERRSLETAGFSFEGVARGSAWRDGAWRDGAIYGLLRTDTRG